MPCVEVKHGVIFQNISVCLDPAYKVVPQALYLGVGGWPLMIPPLRKK